MTQNADAATDTAGVMDLSKVAAAEQYVRALMSRPTTPTGEVTPLSLSVLPADRMPAPDNAVVDNVTESNDQVNVCFYQYFFLSYILTCVYSPMHRHH